MLLLINKVYAIITPMTDRDPSSLPPEVRAPQPPEGELGAVDVFLPTPGEHEGFSSGVDEAILEDRRHIEAVRHGKAASILIGAPERHVSEADREAVARVFGGMSIEQIAAFGMQAQADHTGLNEANLKIVELTEETMIDGETGAYKMKAAIPLLARIGEQALLTNSPLVIMHTDLESVKFANEQTEGGYDTGDIYIQRGAESLRRYFEETGAVIRVNGEGGDEFIVIAAMGENRRAGESNPDYVGQVLSDRTIPGAKGMLRQLLRVDPILSDQMSDEKVRAAGPQWHLPGMSIGAVYVMPEDIATVDREIKDGALNLDQVFNRLQKVTGELMKRDKRNDDEASIARFEPADLLKLTSKFTF